VGISDANVFHVTMVINRWRHVQKLNS